MSARQKIDIEALLVWAYRDQCVDRMSAGFSPRGPGGSLSGGIAEYLTLGTRVDTSGFAAKVLGSGNVADDALGVHDAVLRLDDIFVEWLTDTRLKLWTREVATAEGWAVCEQGKGVGRQYLLTHPHRAPRHLGFIGLSALVIINARDGIRPDWHEGWKPPAHRPANGRGAKDKRGRLRKSAGGVAAEVVVYDRAVYRAWWWALEMLAAQLDGALDGFDVTGPTADSEPWEFGAPSNPGSKCQKYFADNLMISNENKLV